MKKLLGLLAMLLAFTSTWVLADTTEVRNLDKFTKIEHSATANVYLKQGSPQKVEVVAKPELLGNLITEVSNGKLKISMKSQNANWVWYSSKAYTVYITVEKLDAVNLSGSGNLTATTPITGTNLDLGVTGSGDIQAELALSGDLDLGISGSGDVTLKGKFQNLKSRISGSGDADLSAVVTSQAIINISGSGDIKVSGKVALLDASISGSGDLAADQFEADTCKIRVSGSGDAQVFVKSDLDARTSGSGDISYKGDPARVITHNSGSGSVSKI